MASIPEGLAIVEHCSKDQFLWRHLELKMPELRRQLDILADTAMTREDYFNRQIPCIFLSNNRCMIYEARPTSCRTHVSVDDPEKCSVEADSKVDIAFLDLRFLDDGVAREAMRLMKQKKLPMAYGPLQSVLVLATAYYRFGESYLKDRIQNTPYKYGDLRGMASWMHLLKTDPRVTELMQTLQPRSGDDV
jgi:Fe-S-cluster containining protein